MKVLVKLQPIFHGFGKYVIYTHFPHTTPPSSKKKTIKNSARCHPWGLSKGSQWKILFYSIPSPIK